MAEHPDTLSGREFRAHVASVIRAAEEDGHVTTVTRDGKPVGAFVPMFMLEKLAEWEDEQLARRALEAQANDDGQPGVSLTEMYAMILDEPGPPGRKGSA
jgi:prevent-host-death family protein